MDVIAGQEYCQPPLFSTAADALEKAKALAYVRPLVPYPGWTFASDWDNPDLAFQMRRRIWEFFNERRLEIPLQFAWYDGLRLNLYLGNDLSRNLFIAGCSEPNEFAFLSEILKPGMVFADAGANDGLYTLFASRRVGPQGRILAFEPSSREFARLEENIDLNQLPNVTPFRIALADRNAEEDLAIAGFEHEGQNTLGAFAHEEIALLRKERVPVRKLDDILEQERLSRLDFVKIDVEGAECRVINGARQVINRFRPILLVEAVDAALKAQGTGRDELLKLVSSFGYESFSFSADDVNVIAVPGEDALAKRLLSAEERQFRALQHISQLGRPKPPPPYLSLVVTARNDDHGGNLLRRMQIFINGWMNQSRRHNLPSELIIVEWNPPKDRPPLREALSWPEHVGPCEVRFIEVPSELHARYQHAQSLPLYQMIAKNVGIRRAHGQFILATNIDILFSDELVAFLAKRCLDSDRMYRIDRHDVMSDVPLDGSIEQQLEYCRTHLLRLNSREGTFQVDRASEASTTGEVSVRTDKKYQLSLWTRLQGVIDRFASDSPAVTVTFPNPTPLRQVARFYVDCGGFTGMLRNRFRSRPRPKPPAAKPVQEIEFLHTNGCGDFTLLARERWLDLRGYPEFDLFSMNIDSVLCYAAHYSGAREEVLPDPMRIYHIEHATGSGWTPEGQAELFKRLEAKRIEFVSHADVIGWAQQMRRLNCPMIFNHETWGLGDFELAETVADAAVSESVRAVSDFL